MYKQLIDSRNENAVIFLRCYCGGEIISIYHYPATPTCQEIITLDYYGMIESKKLQKYKYYSFDRNTFQLFVNSLERCRLEGPYKKIIECVNSKLCISKKDHTFTEISLLAKTGVNKKFIKVWDITIRNQELEEFTSSLADMEDKIFIK